MRIIIIVITMRRGRLRPDEVREVELQGGPLPEGRAQEHGERRHHQREGREARLGVALPLHGRAAGAGGHPSAPRHGPQDHVRHLLQIGGQAQEAALLHQAVHQRPGQEGAMGHLLRPRELQVVRQQARRRLRHVMLN